MRSPLTYRPRSNILSTFSIKEKYETDYLALRDLLKKNKVSIGEYLVTSYRELDKGSSNNLRLKEIRWSR